MAAGLDYLRGTLTIVRAKQNFVPNICFIKVVIESVFSFVIAACVGAERVAQPQILWTGEQVFGVRFMGHQTGVRCPINGTALICTHDHMCIRSCVDPGRMNICTYVQVSK